MRKKGADGWCGQQVRTKGADRRCVRCWPWALGPGPRAKRKAHRVRAASGAMACALCTARRGAPGGQRGRSAELDLGMDLQRRGPCADATAVVHLAERWHRTLSRHARGRFRPSPGACGSRNRHAAAGRGRSACACESYRRRARHDARVARVAGGHRSDRTPRVLSD